MFVFAGIKHSNQVGENITWFDGCSHTNYISKHVVVLVQEKQMNMRYLWPALLCGCACGSPVNGEGPPPSPQPEASIDASAEEASLPTDSSVPNREAQALTSCAAGNWYVRIIPDTCQFCVYCQIYQTPPSYSVQVGDDLRLLNCSAALTSVKSTSQCTYRNMDKCTPTFTFEGGSELFSWDGTITFQRYTGALPIAIVNGNILWEFFFDEEIGLSGLALGLDAGQPCLYRILLVKGVE